MIFFGFFLYLCPSGNCQKTTLADIFIIIQVMKTRLSFLGIIFPIILLCCSCDKNDLQGETTYTIDFEHPHLTPGSGAGPLRITVCEFTESNDIVESHPCSTDMYIGFQETFTANPLSVKVKVKWNSYKALDPKSHNMWVQKVFFLKKGKHSLFVIDGDCSVAYDQP